MADQDKLDKFIANTDEDMVDAEGIVTTEGGGFEAQPQYRMITNDRIMVSKKQGAVWKSRLEASEAKLRDGGDLDRWDEALRYYRNDQSEKRSDDGDDDDNSRSRHRRVHLNSSGMETENIVFANTSALVPATYAKNPSVELTIEDVDREDWARTAEKLINKLFGKGTTPRINLKPKARRAVVMTTLNNIAYVEIGYTQREQSNEETLSQIEKISKELAECKDRKQIYQLEAQLMALEEKVDVLRPSGPYCRFIDPRNVRVDPDATDHEDSNWLMWKEYMPTEMLKVMYGTPEEAADGDSTAPMQYKSIFKPSHVLKVDNKASANEELSEFSMFKYNDNSSGKEYGYNSEDAFRKAQRTCVWWVWDKATRRRFLYAENDWTWPLWVWNDPYRLDSFYPLIPLEFYTDPTEFYARSETSYYLDQQDGINEINNEFAKSRKMAMGRAIYNKNVIKDEAVVDAFVGGTDRKVIGVDVPADVDLQKAFVPFMPQTAASLQTAIFDKQRLLDSINRVTSVSTVMRNSEYKTNTTNRAIESYESSSQTRLDEKIDAVEDFIGNIGWALLQLCVQFMSDDEVTRLLGRTHGEVWAADKPSLDELQTFGAMSCVGGSSLKPTSAMKKKQATEIGQIIGQFANAIPKTTAKIALRVLERAFDEVVISKEDWDEMDRGIESGDQTEGGNEAAQLEQLIDQLPPPAKQAFAALLQRGVPFKQAVQMILQEVQQAQEAQQGAEGEAPSPASMQ